MPNACRSGRTLAELLVTLTVSGVLFMLLATAFIGNERIVSGSTTIAEMRAHTLQAHAIMPALLSAVRPADLYVVHDTLADFGYPIAAGAVCSAPSSSQLMLAPDSVASGQAFASWKHTPAPGDAAHIFDAGALLSTVDDKWWVASVSGLTYVPNGCSGSPLLDPVADAVHRARILSVTWPGTPPAFIPPGAVVHITRRTRAMLYASSGAAFLGVSNFDPLAGWSVVQPVSGPYVSQPGAPGVHFRLLDSLGAVVPPTGSPASASTLRVNVRSQTATAVRITGMRRGILSDSLFSYIALRNR